MARSVGPELDDLQRLIRRLQTHEVDSSGNLDSAAKPDTAPNLTVVPTALKPPESPEKTTVATTATTSQALVLSIRDGAIVTSAISAEAADADEDGGTTELKTYRGADSVQTTLQELVELRAPEPPRARELLELARRDGEAGGIGHYSPQASPSLQAQHAERNGFNVSLIVAVALATLVSTIASVYLLMTFAAPPPAMPTPAASSTATVTQPTVSQPSVNPATVSPPQANPVLASRPIPLPVEPPTTPAAAAPAAEPAPGSEPVPPSCSSRAAEAGRPGDVSSAAPSADPAITVPTPVAPPAPAIKVAPLTVEAVWLANRGTPFKLPVTITVEDGLATQLLISGLEADAAISNGLELLPGTWLIDQKDVARASLERGAGAKPSLPVDVQLRSADGKLIAREYVLLKSEPAGPPAGAAQ